MHPGTYAQLLHPTQTLCFLPPPSVATITGLPSSHPTRPCRPPPPPPPLSFPISGRPSRLPHPALSLLYRPSLPRPRLPSPTAFRTSPPPLLQAAPAVLLPRQSQPELCMDHLVWKSWRCIDSTAFGIQKGVIPRDAWAVLQMLRRKGFDAYLVGGCVRDLLLKRTPKDFDVITTASLEQMRTKVFGNCIIIGRRFPICLVKMHGRTIEVSSFGVNDCSEDLNGFDKGDVLRWKNSMRRDFTINSLFFNPFKCRIYDYVNGVRDLRNKKVRTVTPAHISFKEDPARILRGFRIAARLGFQFSSKTNSAICDLSSSVMGIGKARLTMEMSYMLAHGVAQSSIRLLRKYRLLDILLPFQAAYLSDQIKGKSSDGDSMLMRLLANLDKFLSADRPCHSSLWLALLALHSALVNSPQDALVIRAFAALLYFGTWENTIKFLRHNIGAPALFVPETLGPSRKKLDNLMEETSHLASLVTSSINMLTCLDALQLSLSRYSDASQFSGVVFVSRNEEGRLLRIFEGLDSDLTSYNSRRGMHEIDYELLKDGHPGEVRFVLGKVIMDTMSEELLCASSDDDASASATGMAHHSPARDDVAASHKGPTEDDYPTLQKLFSVQPTGQSSPANKSSTQGLETPSVPNQRAKGALTRRRLPEASGPNELPLECPSEGPKRPNQRAEGASSRRRRLEASEPKELPIGCPPEGLKELIVLTKDSGPKELRRQCPSEGPKEANQRAKGASSRRRGLESFELKELPIGGPSEGLKELFALIEDSGQKELLHGCPSEGPKEPNKRAKGASSRRKRLESSGSMELHKDESSPRLYDLFVAQPKGQRSFAKTQASQGFETPSAPLQTAAKGASSRRRRDPAKGPKPKGLHEEEPWRP